MFFTPLTHFDHIGRWRRGFDFEGVGRQFDVRGVRAELGDGAGVALVAGHGEFEVIHTRQALAAVGIAGKGDASQGDIAVEQLQIELRAVLLDPLQRAFSQPVGMP